MNSVLNQQKIDTGYGEGGLKFPATIEQPDVEKEEAMQKYRNSGYGQNADGYYFNPNIDEYDPNYDPVKDSLFNKRVRTALTEGLTDEDLLLMTIKRHNQMGDILGVYPYIGIEKTDLNDDKYNISKDYKSVFEIDKKFVEEVNNVAPNIINQYSGLLNKLETHRKKMAEALGIESYPGIENEDIEKHINDISKQLDDWEVDQLRENKEAILEMKRRFPPLFENDITKNNNKNQTQDVNQNDNTNTNTPDDQTQTQNQNPDQTQTQNQNPDQTQTQNQNVDTPQNIDQNNQDGNQADSQQDTVDVDDTQQVTIGDTEYGEGGIKLPAVIGDDGEPVVVQDDDQLDDDLPIDIETFDPPAPAPRQPDFFDRTREFVKKHKILPKALYGAAGFVTGVGLSCVPGVGQVRMVVAGVKLGVSAANLGRKIITTKFPESKISKFMVKVDNGFKEKCPHIYEGIMKFKKWKATPPINWALNGMAMGYIAGNVFELMTGETVAQTLFSKPQHIGPVVPDGTTFDNLEPGQTPANTRFIPNPDGPIEPIRPAAPVTPLDQGVVRTGGVSSTVDTVVVPTQVVPDVSVVPDVPVVPDTTALETAIKAGQNVDISSIPFGRVSSDAENAVKLLQSAGKNVHFLREVTLSDGTVMWAMDQANGLGYAWFPKEQVLETVSQLGNTVVR